MLRSHHLPAFTLLVKDVLLMPMCQGPAASASVACREFQQCHGVAGAGGCLVSGKHGPVLTEPHLNLTSVSTELN